MVSNLYDEYRAATEEYKALLQKPTPCLSSSRKLGANAETIAYIGYFKEKLRLLSHLLLIREAIVHRCLGESRNVIVWEFCKSYHVLLLKWTVARNELDGREKMLYPKEVAEKGWGTNTLSKMDPVRGLAIRRREPDYTDIPDAPKSIGGEIAPWGDYSWAHSRLRTPPILGEFVKTYLDPSTYHSEWPKGEYQIAFRALSLCAIKTLYANPSGYWQVHCEGYANFSRYLQRRSVEDSDIDDYTPDLWNLLKGLRSLNLQSLKDSLAPISPPPEKSSSGVEVFLGRQVCIPDPTVIFDRLSWKIFYKISDIPITDALGICRTFEQMHQLYVFEAFGFLPFWKKKGLLVGRGGRFWDLVMRGFLCLTTGPCSERIMALLSAAAGVTLNMFQMRYWMLGFMSKETTEKQLNDLVRGFGGNIDIVVVDPPSKTAKNVSSDETLWLPTSKSLPEKQDIWGARCTSRYLEFKPLMQEVKKVFESYHLDPESMNFSEFKTVILINRLHNKPIMFGTLAGAYTLGEVFEVGMHAMQKYMAAVDFNDFTSNLYYPFYGPALRRAGEDSWSRGESFQERWFISNLLLSLIDNRHLVKLPEDTPKPSADIRILVTSDGRDFPMPHFWINYPKHSVDLSPRTRFADKQRKLNGIGRRRGNCMTILTIHLPDFWYPTDISPPLALATRFTDSDGTVYEWRKPPYDYPGSVDAWCAALSNLFDLKDGIHAVYDRIYIITPANDDGYHEARVAMVHEALLSAGVCPGSSPSSWTTCGVFKDFGPADEGGLGRYLWRDRAGRGKKVNKGKWVQGTGHECYAARYLEVVKEVLGATPEALSLEIVKDVLSATPPAPPVEITSSQ